MRRSLLQATPLAAALTLGALAGCFHEDYLLGAYCVREEDCGADQCCAGVRCRPRGDDCTRGLGYKTPFDPAYKPCDSDAECIVHGLVRCAHWDDAPVGFCTDLCVGPPLENCELHTFGYPSETIPRTCVTVDDQSVCALDCAADGRCPSDMLCRTGVCVPDP